MPAMVRPTVRQWLLDVRDKAKQVKYRGTSPLQLPPPFPFLALIHTSLSRVSSDQLQASGLVESITRKERSRSIYTVRQA